MPSIYKSAFGLRTGIEWLLLIIMLGGLLLMPNANATTVLTDDAKAVYALLGIEPQVLRLSAAGYMLDFRYRVSAPKQAAKWINRDTNPYLIDEASGARVGVPAPPKIGPLRNTGGHLVEGRTYFILFANPAKKIERGDRVSVVLGEQRIEHLVVQ